VEAVDRGVSIESGSGIAVNAADAASIEARWLQNGLYSVMAEHDEVRG